MHLNIKIIYIKISENKCLTIGTRYVRYTQQNYGKIKCFKFEFSSFVNLILEYSFVGKLKYICSKRTFV